MKNPIYIAIIITVIAVLWIVSGLFSNNEQPADTQQSATTTEENEIQEVRVRDLTAQLMEDRVEVTGRTQASRQIYIRTEANGRIVKLYAEKGESVKAGQLLAKLDAQDRAAQVAQAEELLKQRDVQYIAAKELAEKGFNSRVRLAEASAQLEQAKADLAQARVELSNIVIKAPFDGVLNKQDIELGDYVSTGDNLFQLVDLQPIEISGFLTEKQMEYVSVGTQATAELLKEQTVTGGVTFIAAAANTDTRTFLMEMSVDNSDHKIREGLTAKIIIPTQDSNAYKISPSILSLADDGTVGVKIVNDNDIVEFKPIRLLKDTPEFLWVGGLPKKIRLITVGQEFVVPDQRVKPILSDEDEGSLL